MAAVLGCGTPVTMMVRAISTMDAAQVSMARKKGWLKFLFMACSFCFVLIDKWRSFLRHRDRTATRSGPTARTDY